ncbi:SDR family NAD(P)-dependent oxidoreductase [Candidatus Gottesmanbacteria bacterium]|nr:SDR family NAD(P)-dependent oxidoreductase [Candidatus Gottesmanbacteria bacterium]
MSEKKAFSLPSLGKKKILITGGLGFIGSNLARTCVGLGARVTIYDSVEKHSGANFYNIVGIEKKIQFLKKDIRNFDDVSQAVYGQDILFNCAAYTSHPDSMREPLIDVDVNCKGVITLLDAARKRNPSLKFVQIGTSTQIGKMHAKKIDELHPEFPLDIYSANKCASEKYVLLYAHAYKLDATVLRLANVYGPRSNIKSSDFGFINYFIGLGLCGKKITVFGKGSQIRTVIYIQDAVSALIKASVSPKSRGNVYFVSSSEYYAVGQIAQYIVQYIGGSIAHVPWSSERKAIESGNAIIDNRKIVHELKWQPAFTISEGLVLTKKYFLSCLQHYLS